MAAIVLTFKAHSAAPPEQPQRRQPLMSEDWGRFTVFNQAISWKFIYFGRIFECAPVICPECMRTLDGAA